MGQVLTRLSFLAAKGAVCRANTEGAMEEKGKSSGRPRWKCLANRWVRKWFQAGGVHLSDGGRPFEGGLPYRLIFSFR